MECFVLITAKGRMTMKDRLKGLLEQRDKLKGRLRDLDRDYKKVKKRVGDTVNSLHKIEKQINALTERDPLVTDHAIVRYFERVEGVNIKDVKKKILTDKVKTQINALGSGEFPLGSGVRVVVRDNQVITVITD
jgi:chromosome segregation ATPase